MENLTDSTILRSFISSGPFIWTVFGCLVIASLWSWSIILTKWIDYRKTVRLDKRFMKDFNQATDLVNFCEKLKQDNRDQVGLAAVLSTGVDELKRLPKNFRPELGAESVRRAMSAKAARMIDESEQGLSTLASIASISPYVGLLGTVWGIIHAFSGLAGMEQATLAAVAPGISEALVATAIGLVVAIPSSWAYNQFVRSMERFTVRVEALVDEFSRLTLRADQ
jgi:biopolymer transport protein TolQ